MKDKILNFRKFIANYNGEIIGKDLLEEHSDFFLTDNRVQNKTEFGKYYCVCSNIVKYSNSIKTININYDDFFFFLQRNNICFTLITDEEELSEYFKQHIGPNFYKFEKCTKAFNISQEGKDNWSFRDLLVMALYNNDPVNVVFDKTFNTYKFKSIIHLMPELSYVELIEMLQEYKLEHKLDLEKNIWISTEPIEVFCSKRLIT